MRKALYAVFVLFFLGAVSAAVYAESGFSDREEDIYFDMATSVNNLSLDDATEENKNEQIRLTGDKYGMTYEDARELYERGEANEFDD